MQYGTMISIMRKYVVPHEGNSYRPYLLRFAGVVLMLGLVVGSFFVSNVHRIALRASDFLASVLPGVLVDLANNDRQVFNLGSLTINEKLTEAARMKAEDMAAKSYFAHYSPDGVSPWYWISQVGYTFAYAGENLAVHFDDSAAVNAAWMDSPGHRANLLNENFTEIGIATAQGVFEGRPTVFVVQMFGRPARVASAVTEAPAPAEEEIPSVTETPSTETVAPIVVSSTDSEESSPETTEVSAPIAVEPTVVPVIEMESDDGRFVAVENADVLAENAPGLYEVGAPSYSSYLERFVTSPTHTLALIYLALSVILFALLFASLVVRHDRRLRNVSIVLLLFFLLCGVYYAYRAFVQSEGEVTVVAVKTFDSRWA